MLMGNIMRTCTAAGARERTLAATVPTARTHLALGLSLADLLLAQDEAGVKVGRVVPAAV
jgi:hypothetical protein